MYCIYHSRDLDGWMSAAIHEQFAEHLEPYTQIGWDYGDPIPELEEGRTVYLIDISFPIETMAEIAKTNPLIWIDHHKSAIQDYNEYVEVHGDFLRDKQLPMVLDGEPTKTAACELTWMYCYPGKVAPAIVGLLGAYDSFRFKGKPGEEYVLNVQYGSRSLISNPYLCGKALNGQITVGTLENAGAAVRAYLDNQAESLYEKRMVWAREVAEYDKVIYAAAVNAAQFNPKSHGIEFEEDGYDMFISYTRNANGTWTFSLYSSTIDVSILAKAMGGGGHAGAAGFVADDLKFIEHGQGM